MPWLNDRRVVAFGKLLCTAATGAAMALPVGTLGWKLAFGVVGLCGVLGWREADPKPVEMPELGVRK